MKQHTMTIGYCVLAFLAGNYTGYYNGITKSELDWHKKLVDASYAEYNRKTGDWGLRKMEDVVEDGLLFGKTKSAPVVGAIEAPVFEEASKTVVKK